MPRPAKSLAFVIPVAVAMTWVIGREPEPGTLPPSTLNTDEEILFYPTYGRFDEQTQVWRFEVHGKVYEPEDSSFKRRLLISALKSTVRGDAKIDKDAILSDRIRPFLVDNERGKSVTIDLAGNRFAAGVSAANGHFRRSLVSGATGLGVDPKQIGGPPNRVLNVKAVLPAGDSRTFDGRIHLIAPRGVSVISDIDDTIKHSRVTDKSELLQNTFTRAFRAVEGMPELYADLADVDVAFHYVSGSPWQLYQPLESFFADQGFPKGTYHLKHFRLTDSSGLGLLSSQRATKLAAIEPLLGSFPERRFILLGDSGEHDPEIYGQLARDYPDQIAGIFIRNVTASDRTDGRFQTAFEQVPADRWRLFDDVSQIRDAAVELAK
ncbi:App1 family protein [Stieleria sp. ICT_E10.1]|uniref:phosphatidate phosphatase App1 family protein n=1 Tax=Stieleria sedimenti TaxID=2976331 RepID=UPI00217FE9AA|nr:App1 family protein [Stieleria sedimenti]MCS7466081.1 App1 family protein [Stieleria sedimenti]